MLQIHPQKSEPTPKGPASSLSAVLGFAFIGVVLLLLSTKRSSTSNDCWMNASTNPSEDGCDPA